jgi:hypothetical protein
VEADSDSSSWVNEDESRNSSLWKREKVYPTAKQQFRQIIKEVDRRLEEAERRLKELQEDSKAFNTAFSREEKYTRTEYAVTA